MRHRPGTGLVPPINFLTETIKRAVGAWSIYQSAPGWEPCRPFSEVGRTGRPPGSVRQPASHARMQRTAGGPLRQTHKQRDRKMILQDAFDLFRRLGVHSEMISRPEFSAAYYGLARRFHPDVNPATHELMANINAARTTILQSYRRSS